MKKVENVVCTGCALTCNDIVVILEGNSVIEVWGSCRHGTKRIKELERERLKCSEDDIDTAIEKAVSILASAKKPLIYGFSSSLNRSIEIGLKIAEKVNGVFDSPPSICHIHIPLAKENEIKNVKLEEVLEKSDFIMYFFANIADTHLRHASRYTIFPRGEVIKSGRESRTVLAIDYFENENMKIAQHRIIVKPGMEIDFLKRLRESISTGKIPSLEELEITLESWAILLDDIKKSTFISAFAGPHILSNIMSREIYRELISLVKAISATGRESSLIPLAEDLNSMGAALIPYKLLGATHAIEFSNGNPIRNPTTTNASSKLLSGEVDAALIVGSDPYVHLPRSIVKRLKEIPIIYVGERKTIVAKISEVNIPIAINGIESGGTIFRIDGEEIELTPFMKPPEGIESEDKVLKKILAKL